MKYRYAIAGAIAGLFFGIGLIAYEMVKFFPQLGRSEYLILFFMTVILASTGALAGIGIRRIVELSFPKK